VRHLVVTLTGCESSGLKCTSAGRGEGEIESNSLEGALGNVTGTLPGLRLYREGEAGKEPKEGALQRYQCGGGLSDWTNTGSIVGALGGAHGTTVEEGSFSSSLKLTFAETSGAEKYTTFRPGECGGAGECGPEQLTSTVNGTPELEGVSDIWTVKSAPF